MAPALAPVPEPTVRVRVELSTVDRANLGELIPPYFDFKAAPLHGKARAEAQMPFPAAKQLIIDLSTTLVSVCTANALIFTPMGPDDYDLPTIRVSLDAKGAWAAEVALAGAYWIKAAALDHSQSPPGLCLLPRSSVAHAALILLLQQREAAFTEGGPASFCGGLSVATLELSGDPDLWLQAQTQWLAAIQDAIGGPTCVAGSRDATRVIAYVPTANVAGLAQWPKRFLGHLATVAAWRPKGGGWRPANGNGNGNGNGPSQKGWTKWSKGRGGRRH